MNLTKKILLSLIFALSFTFTIYYLINSILNTIKPPWYHGGYVNGDIFWWVFFGVFFFASFSSILWLNPKTSQFWFLKIPALLILPFSIPFLILDYLEFQKKQKTTKMNNKNIYQKRQINLTILVIIVSLNLIIIILQTSFLRIPIAYSQWFWFLILIPISMLCGSIFLILNYFYHKKSLAWLSALGLTLNWFYLFLELIEKRKVNYFFKTTKIPHND